MNHLPANFLYIAGAPINKPFWQLSQKGYIMVPYKQMVPNKQRTMEGADGHGAGDSRSGTPYGGRRQPGI